MTTKLKVVVSGLALAILTTFGVVMNVATSNAAPAQPFRQPTPIPAKPHSLVLQPDTWSIPGPHACCGGIVGEGLTMEPDGIGWPGTTVGWA